MLKIRNYFIVFAVAFAISTSYALIGIQDAKAQAAGSGAAYTDLIKRIEALEANGVSNVTAGDITGLKIGFEVRHRFEQREQFPVGSVGNAYSVDTGTSGTVVADTLGRILTYTSGTANQGERSREVDTEFTLQRVRLTFDADINKNVRGFIKLQDSRTFGAEQATTGNLGRTDLLEGYAELRNLGDLNSILTNVELRVGRWQAAYGNDRLIGTLNWTNQARAYDGGRVRWDNKKNAWIDVFAFQVQENNTAAPSGDVGVVSAVTAGTTTPTTEIGFLPNITGRKDEVLYGVYSQFKIYKGNVFEPYLLARAISNDINTASTTVNGSTEQRYTAGFRLDGKDIPGLGGLDYTVEPAWQFGKVDYVQTGLGLPAGTNFSSPIQAFAVYAGGGYTFKNIPWTPRIGYAYAFASGDERPTTGSAKTFDHLYPTGHAQLGYIDFVAWQNIKDHQIHLSFKPTKKLGVDVKGHIFELDEEADSWYSVGGGTGYGGSTGAGVIRAGADYVVDPKTGVTRRVDDELGQEIDLTVTYSLFKNFGVVAGYSHFFAGDFVEDTGAGIDRGSDWAYLQTTLSF